MDNLDQTKRELMDEVKGKLIEELNLEEITPEDIDNEAPLFGDEGLGLDSIDALEIILILEREYGIKIENPSEGKQIFYSVRTLADYIIANRKGLTDEDIRHRIGSCFGHRYRSFRKYRSVETKKAWHRKSNSFSDCSRCARIRSET